MSEPLLFWRRPLELKGGCTPETAAYRLRSMLSQTTRFSTEERLIGRADGWRVRVWKKTLLGGSSDLVQFEGEIAPDALGTVIRGTLAYKLATRVQFVGFVALGGLMAASGVLQKSAGSPTADEVTLFGAGIAAVTIVWMLAAHSMRDKQIDFIAGKLRELLAPEET